eukprot:GEMP01052560.1.p1 GENE.GEMP01052560.1~~GEMP01052560.1.p1  ORF type:complete len:104 (+),score=0.09 GEMP01052560.1:492-803(+)
MYQCMWRFTDFCGVSVRLFSLSLSFCSVFSFSLWENTKNGGKMGVIRRWKREKKTLHFNFRVSVFFTFLLLLFDMTQIKNKKSKFNYSFILFLGAYFFAQVHS